MSHSTPVSAGIGVGRGQRVDLFVSVLLAGAITGPLVLSTGFWLAGDMVFVPFQPWKPEWLGLDGTLPRAVPGDAVVSALTYLLPGTVVQRLLIVGGLVLGGLGAGRLVADRPWFARVAAITLWLWNPFVYERLLIGQWAILAGSLILPWVVIGARAASRGERRGWGLLGVTCVLCATASPTTGLLAAGLAVVIAARRTRHLWLRLVPLVVLANLGWLVPALASSSSIPVGAEGFIGFAPAAESAAGRLASLFSLGGIWKVSILPQERTQALIVLASCVVSVLALVGWWLPRDQPPLRLAPVRRLLHLGLLTLLLVWAWSLPGGARVAAAVAEVVPPIAIVRDSHRLLIVFGLALLPGIAGFVTWLAQQARPGREAIRGLVVALVLAPVLLLPSLIWGAAGELRPSTYPAEWKAVAQILEAAPGRTVVLPWSGSYRRFDWAHQRAVLDPAPRFFPGEVMYDDRVLLPGVVIASEDPVRRAVGAALDQPSRVERTEALRRLGVRWVLVEKDQPGALEQAPEGTTRYGAIRLSLIDLGSSVAPTSTSRFTIRDFAIVVTQIFVLVFLLTSFGMAVDRRG